jgi:hypothetical protein
VAVDDHVARRTSRDIRRVIPTPQMQNEACRTRVI